jgi:hypothetical protein
MFMECLDLLRPIHKCLLSSSTHIFLTLTLVSFFIICFHLLVEVYSNQVEWLHLAILGLLFSFFLFKEALFYLPLCFDLRYKVLHNVFELSKVLFLVAIMASYCYFLYFRSTFTLIFSFQAIITNMLATAYMLLNLFL